MSKVLIHISCLLLVAYSLVFYCNAVPTDATAQTLTVGDFATPQETQEALDEANINFDNASLSSVVYCLGQQKNIDIIPNKDLEAVKVSLTTHNPLTLDRAWGVLLTLLEMNGFTLLEKENTKEKTVMHYIVSNQNNGQEALPLYSSEQIKPEDLPDSDQVLRYIYVFKNIKVEAARAILEKMIEPKNIVDNKDLNLCTIKDQSRNIKAAMRIMKELDEGGLREAIEVIPLKNASADNVAKLFTDVLGAESTTDQQRVIRISALQSKEATYFAAGTKVLSEPITNSIILLGAAKNVEKIKNFILKYIDVPIDNAESRLHIRELRYMKAQDLEPVLLKIIQPPSGTATEKALIMEGGYKVFEDVFIKAETETSGEGQTTKHGNGNRLAVACNREDWKRISAFIDKLDKPQPQVAMEIMVVDVNLDQSRALGFQMRNLKGKSLGKNINAEFAHLLAMPVFRSNVDGTDNTNASLLNINKSYAENSFYPSSATFGRAGDQTTPDNIWGVLIASLQSTNAQVISQPYVIANNHQTCEIVVSKKLRVQGGLDFTKNVSTVVQKQVDLEAAITIKLTPHINLVGTIDLDIDININQFKEASTVRAQSDQTILKRTLKTKSSMGTGEVLGLGGFTTSKQIEGMRKTPILGDIPIIGNLFKYKSKDKTEQNIYVFMRPSIIKPRFEGEPDEYTQLKLDYAKLQIMKSDMYVADRDPIQRWFFKPTNQSIKHRIDDAARGILRPLDDFTYGKRRPKSVSIQDDPYYQVGEAITEQRTKEAAIKEQQEAVLALEANKQAQEDSEPTEDIPQQEPLQSAAAVEQVSPPPPAMVVPQQIIPLEQVAHA
ncbi:MAG: secretin N-terminal domain-containing protein [Candidatus Babeliales bacterium]|jgi:general secretion pathway protein D